MADQIQPSVPLQSTAVIRPKDWTPEMRASAMQTLVSTPGWELLVYLLKEEKKRWNSELENGEHKGLAEVENLQYKIAVVKKLLAFPPAIIKEPSIEKLDQLAQLMQGFDPYPTLEDEDEEET